jgi:hypothetical protein
MTRTLITLMLALALQGCTTPQPRRSAMPELRLAPAEAGQTLALAQRLTISRQDQTQTVEAMLELSETKLELALLLMGQPVARLSWDGRTLQEQRVPGLPEQVSAQRILTDLQLVVWPAVALARALPPGWSLGEQDGLRELRQQGDVVARVRYRSRWDAELENLREGYRLRIESVPLSN